MKASLRWLPCLLLLLGALPVTGATAGGGAEFPQGVASRAETRSARLWSRAGSEGAYDWQVAVDRRFHDVVAHGVATARLESDLTLKARARRLRPGTRYFYRFVGDGPSPIGTFETAPRRDRGAPLEIAFSGDSDVLWTDHPDPASRPFEVLTRIREEHPDLFIYLGDTVYSDSETGADPALLRAEKWAKYRDNRIGPTRRLLASTSTWALWDDHETINDYDGAELIVDDPALFQAGIRAFSDYWPVPKYWPLGRSRTYWKLDWGKNIDLLFLDERTYRTRSADEPADTPCRDEEGELDLAPMMPPEDREDLGMGPADPDCIANVLDPTRTMLGAEQKAWLKRRLRDDSSKWKLIVNQVPIVQLFVLPYDRWEGYAAERTELLQFIEQRNVRGVVFLTTDIHAHIGSPTFVDFLEEGAEPVAYEVVTGPIQTCTLSCETERILGFPGAGGVLRSFLISHDLIYTEDGEPHCAGIDEYGYSQISTDAPAKKLKVEWRSWRAAPGGGGRRVDDCPPRTLTR